jgi:hypothetical protein
MGKPWNILSSKLVDKPSRDEFIVKVTWHNEACPFSNINDLDSFESLGFCKKGRLWFFLKEEDYIMKKKDYGP